MKGRLGDTDAFNRRRCSMKCILTSKGSIMKSNTTRDLGLSHSNLVNTS